MLNQILQTQPSQFLKDPLSSGGGNPAIPFPEYATQILRISPNAENATIETITQTFDPSDVITADNRIDVSFSGVTYGAFATTASGLGTRVQFSTTGTLPSSINASDYYYLSPNGSGGYDVYPEYTDANKSSLADNLTNMFIEENALPAQNYVQQANKIEFADQGTGTHTITSRPLIKNLPNMLTGGQDVELGFISTNMHDRFELRSDGSKYAIIGETRYRDPEAYGSYDRYGIATDMDGADMEAWNNLTRNKRVLALTLVQNQKEVKNINIYKSPIIPSNVNTTTGVLTTDANHSHSTGRKVQVRAHPTGTLPTGFSTGGVTSQGVTSGTTYFVRDLGNTTISLHPTKADADNNTNVVIPSTQGTVGFTVLEIQSGGDRERMRFPVEFRQPPTGSLNCLIPRTHDNFYASANEYDFATRFVANGTHTGRVGGAGLSMDDLPAANQLQGITGDPDDAGIGVVRLTYPLASIPVTRDDTGQYLAQGIYYITDDPQSSVFVRLHDTIQDARDSVGVNNADSTTHIKFSALGEGFCRFDQAQNYPLSIDTEKGSELVNWSPVDNEKCVITYIVDYNDPAASNIKFYIYKNGVQVLDHTTSLSKGNTTTPNGADSILTLMNSPQAHVPYEGDIYDILIDASSAAIPEAQVEALHAYYQSEYNI